MRKLRWAFYGLIFINAAAAIIACVGDTTTPVDGGGPDATTDNFVPPPDASGDAIADGEGGIGPAPTPDGGLVWLNHYNSNHGFSDLVVNESGGITYVIGGAFGTDPGAGNTFNFGSINLGPATGYDLFAGEVSSTGSSLVGKSAATSAVAGDAQSQNLDIYTTVAVDSSGNIYAYGSSTSASITLTSTLSGPTSFVVKLSPTGAPLWQHPYAEQNSGVDGPVSLAVSGSTLFAAMSYSGTLTYDNGVSVTSQSSEDVFITAIDTTTGATIWAKSYGSGGNDYVGQLTTTPQGDAILVGSLNGNLGEADAGFSIPQIGDSGTGQDLFVLKVSKTGTPTYGLAYGDPSSGVTPTSVAFNNGTIAIAGSFGGAVDFGKGTLTSVVGDGFVMTIDETTKQTKFVAQLTGSANDGFTSVALDPWGEVIAAGTYGQYNGGAQIGAKVLPQTSVAVAAMVLAKWDASGTLLWTDSYVPTLDGGGAPYGAPDAANGVESIVPTRIQTTNTGIIVLTGAMAGGTDFGQGYVSQLSTLHPPFKCGGTPLCNITFPPTCIYCPGVPVDGIIGTWRP